MMATETAARMKFEDAVSNMSASLAELTRGLLDSALDGRCRESRRGKMMDAARRIVHELETF